jgi:thiol-disulfide isomerase/thioredoxin
MEKKTSFAALAFILIAGCTASIPDRPPDPVERGWVKQELLRTAPYQAFGAGLDTATIEMPLVPLIKATYDAERVVVVFGGWCGDSKREVPRFLKLAAAAGIPADSVLLYAVDRTKKGADGVPQRYAIEKVPTFIVEKNGVEVGRIVESPKVTLASDFLQILGEAKGK